MVGSAILFLHQDKPYIGLVISEFGKAVRVRTQERLFRESPGTYGYKYHSVPIDDIINVYKNTGRIFKLLYLRS